MTTTAATATTTAATADINTSTGSFSNGIEIGVGVDIENINGNESNNNHNHNMRPKIVGSKHSNNDHHQSNNNAGDIGKTNRNGNGIETAAQRAIDVAKRKKLKSRNGLPHSGYSKEHLDAWLDTCLKDASNTHLSSSSEFLDYNPSPAAKISASSVLSGMNKNFLVDHVSSRQAQKSNMQQPTYSSPIMMPSNIPQQPPSQSQSPFGMRMNLTSQTNPTNYTSGNYNIPFGQGMQRSMAVKNPGMYMGHHYPMMFPPLSGGGFFPHLDGSQDFASLPPLVNLMGSGGGGGGGTSEHENNSTDVLDGSGSNPNISHGFRFSDPCLLNPSDNDSKTSGQQTPDRRGNVPTEGMDSNKFYSALMEQISLLHETNSKICRNLHETKVDIEALKHAPSWGLRHRRDSLSGLSTHSQPMVFGGGMGTHSPAPTYHSGAYTPGMMTDVVREVKEAARVREDALLNRVKSMVEERQWSMSECNMRMMRDIEDLKSQIQHLRTDRKEMSKRMTHLESENKYMRQMLTTILQNASVRDVIHENESLRMRSKPPHSASRRSQSFNLHYGTIHHQPAATTTYLLEEESPLANQPESTPSPSPTTSPQMNTKKSASNVDGLRNSLTSSDEGASMNVISGHDNGKNNYIKVDSEFGTIEQQVMSPPNFALVSPPSVESQKPINTTTIHVRSKEDSLRKELNQAVAARKEADNRIIALENLVKYLQVNHPSRASATTTTTIKSHDDRNITNGDGIHIFEGVDINFGVLPRATITAAAPIVPANNVAVAHSPPKLSVAGPITDL